MRRRRQARFFSGPAAARRSLISCRADRRLRMEPPSLAAWRHYDRRWDGEEATTRIRRIFVRRQIDRSSEGEHLVALSTSGNSPNVILGGSGGAFAALLVAFHGGGWGKPPARLSFCLNVPSQDAAATTNANHLRPHACSLIEVWLRVVRPANDRCTSRTVASQK